MHDHTMSPTPPAALLFLILLALTSTTSHELAALRAGVLRASRSVNASLLTAHQLDTARSSAPYRYPALADCAILYQASEARLAGLLGNRTREDALTWLSSVLANHRTCLDGLGDEAATLLSGAHNLTRSITHALTFYANGKKVKGRTQHGHEQEHEKEHEHEHEKEHEHEHEREREKTMPRSRSKRNNEAISLAAWSSERSPADIVVAKDGSGSHVTINAALAALTKMGRNRPSRVIIYVKAGVYHEKVEILRSMKNVMFVGDGIDKTIVTGDRNVPDGSTTYSSATFGVSGDGFWARDITFENTAGPAKGQAVALRVSSDLSIFYRCSFLGYQDTLFVHSLRQFYRDCQVYGTIDFIFGDASAVFQNCDIMLRRPTPHKGNVITAQGRVHPDENTGISIQSSRVRPARDFIEAKQVFRTYLGRPWRKYSRTVIMKTELDGSVDPRGWSPWTGDFALSTLYYAEYMNTGSGASTDKRVTWPGFHVLTRPQQAFPFCVSSFIQGESWIPETDVPFSLDI